MALVNIVNVPACRAPLLSARPRGAYNPISCRSLHRPLKLGSFARVRRSFAGFYRFAQTAGFGACKEVPVTIYCD
jgi:hypothetical protein